MFDSAVRFLPVRNPRKKPGICFNRVALAAYNET